MDPRNECLLIADRTSGRLIDRTMDVDHHRRTTQAVEVTFAGSSRVFPYGPDRVVILREPTPVHVGPRDRVEVDGSIWKNATDVIEFAAGSHRWRRVFYRTRDGLRSTARPATDIVVFQDVASSQTRSREVMAHWDTVISCLPDEDPLRRSWERLSFVHPESALATFLSGGPVLHHTGGGRLIFPFRSNLSQQQATRTALESSMSIIEGPPGTGKTETITTIIANLLAAGSKTVGVVSSNHMAVVNVAEKLDEAGIGFVCARLGRRDRREAFFEDNAQDARSADVESFLSRDHGETPPDQLMEFLRHQAGRRYELERLQAEVRAALRAHELEEAHFRVHANRSTLPDLTALPLLRRSSDRILDFLAEAELQRWRGAPGLLARLRRYLRFGSLKGLDPDDSDLILSLQGAFYSHRIGELRHRLQVTSTKLLDGGIAEAAEQLRAASNAALQSSLHSRYTALDRRHYSAVGYRSGREFRHFTSDYPVVLSTCHSILGSIADHYLFDHLIIDESSQVDLLAGALAMSCCRNLVVVGDSAQLARIEPTWKADPPPPAPHASADPTQHSLLSAVLAHDDGRVPRTTLLEHYRCHPDIIGFCNEKFYGGELVVMSRGGDGSAAMEVWATTPGNHMRLHRGGGVSNQREIDVIVEEVFPQRFNGLPSDDIGIATPYRRQVSKLDEASLGSAVADTVHSFQGRQQDVMIMTSVVDDSWRGRAGLRFVDDRRLINVAVSRARRLFILVTHHGLLPASHNLSDLIGYVGYLDPNHPLERSQIESVFDLLYQQYSDRLKVLAGRLRGEMRFRSEDIVWTVLNDLLLEEQYRHLSVRSQVMLRNLIADPFTLDPDQRRFVRSSSSVDFLVSNRITKRPVLAIEVDGFAFHENNPAQLRRDAMKGEILRRRGLPLLRLPTTGSREISKVRAALDAAGARRTPPA